MVHSPDLEIFPPSGVYSPEIKRSKVDLPVPLAPIKPILAFGLM
jgi:hypothetical protein